MAAEAIVFRSPRFARRASLERRAGRRDEHGEWEPSPPTETDIIIAGDPRPTTLISEEGGDRVEGGWMFFLPPDVAVEPSAAANDGDRIIWRSRRYRVVAVAEYESHLEVTTTLRDA